MANSKPMPGSRGHVETLNEQRKMFNGSPKMVPSKSVSSKIKQIANGTRTGDVVSDESDSGSEEGDNSAVEDDEDDDSGDEADAHALSAVGRSGKIAASRLAGRVPECDALPGAESEAVDDDDYEGVGNISDSDEDELDGPEDIVLQAAEKDLIAEFEETERPRTANAMSHSLTNLTLAEDNALARRLSLQSEESNLEELDFNQDPFGGLSTTDSLYQDLMDDAEGDFDGDLASWRIPAIPDTASTRQNSIQWNGNEKRVRFVETATATSSRSSSMSSEEEDPRDSFPDLLDGGDDHMTRSQFLMDIDSAIDDDNESVYDYEFADQYEKMAFDIDQESDDEDEDEDMSDDADSGDDTEEEGEEEQLARMRAMQARTGRTPVKTPASTPSSTTSAPSTPVGGKRPSVSQASISRAAKSERKPKSGTFTHDPTRAVLTSDVKQSRTKLVCPTKPSEEDKAFWERARQAIRSRDGSPSETLLCPTPRAASIPQRPFTAKSTLGTMFDNDLSFLQSNDSIGIAKDFQPSRPTSVHSSITSLSNMNGSAHMAPNSLVNMNDYVRLSDSDSDMEDDEGGMASMTTAANFFQEFTNDSSPLHRLENDDLLDHFDQQPGLVSSFRNNQHHARHVSSLAAHPKSRAQTSEANALQKGRRSAANTPITPARKKRQSQDFDLTGAGIRKALASPLAQKRQARSRGNSLSQTLALDRFSQNTN